MPVPHTRKNPAYTLLTIRVEEHHVRIRAGTNLALYGSTPVWIDADEPVYTFESLLTLQGTCIDPQDRSGAPYDITLVGEQSPPRTLRLKVKVLQERDHDNVPCYRTYRGVRYPISGTAQPDICEQDPCRTALDYLDTRIAQDGYGQPAPAVGKKARVRIRA